MADIHATHFSGINVEMNTFEVHSFFMTTQLFEPFFDGLKSWTSYRLVWQSSVIFEGSFILSNTGRAGMKVSPDQPDTVPALSLLALEPKNLSNASRFSCRTERRRI